MKANSQMNSNLIKNLSDQAKQSIPAGIVGVEQWIDLYNEQFAKLVLEECFIICEQGTSTQTTSAGVSTLIKQRFDL